MFFGTLFSFFLSPFNFSLHAQSRDNVAISPEAYLQRLQTAGADTLRDEYETELVILLEENEKKAYQALSLPQRREYIALYWRLRDPDPFTPENERLVEHLQRRAHVHEHFHTGKPPYFDDRGKIYLKYGRPQFRYVDPGGVNMTINQDLSLLVPDGGFAPEQVVFDSSGIRRISQTNPPHPWQRTASLLPPGSVSVLANETWSYDNIQSGLVFNFVRQGKDFKLTPDLQSAVNGGRLRHRVLQASVLYLQRQNISPLYFELARELETVGHEMRSSTGGVSSQRLEDKLYRAVKQTASDIKEAMREAPPEAFIHRVKTAALPFVAEVAQFRGERNQTRVAIGFGVNLGESGMNVDATGHWLNGVIYSYALNNLRGEPVSRADRQQTVPATASGAASVLGSVGVMEFDCNPNSYILALQAADASGLHKSLTRLPLLVRDFNGSALMLSDIQLYMPISTAAPPSEASAEVAAAKTIPYPFSTVLKSLPLTIYFEIYNLSAVGLNNEYRIDYNVTETPKGKNIFSAITKPFRKDDEASITLSEMRTVTQPTSRESLMLDFGKLRPGAYQLEVRVSALQDSSLVAGAAKAFVLVEEKK